MDALFCLTPDSLAPAPGARKLSATEAALLCDAGTVLATARERADAIVRAAEETYAARKEEGYRDGLEAGRLVHAEKILETVMSSVAFIEGVEASLVDVVREAIRKIIAETPPDERILGVVRTGLASMRQRERVTIRVCPEDEIVLRQALAAMLASSPGKAAFLELVPDMRLERGSCLLESEMGVVDASLETQIKALEKALGDKIRQE